MTASLGAITIVSTFTLLRIHGIFTSLQTQEQLRVTGALTKLQGVAVRMANPPHDMPTTVRGRNLVIVGDSVDREAATEFCKLYGGVHAFNLTKMNAEQGSVSGDGRGGYGCHFNHFDVSLMYFHHPGVMSLPPQHSWHAENNQLNPKRHARLWHLQNGTSLNASSDLARIYWRRAVEENLPKRPVILLAQSSHWDSILAKEYLLKRGDNLNLEHLEKTFGKTFGANSGWNKRASAFLQTLWDTGLHIEKKLWRTNANCPLSGRLVPFVSEVNEMLANEARRMIANKEGPWNGVRLMDWRKEFNVTNPSWCRGIHFSHEGYLTYFQSLWDSLA